MLKKLFTAAAFTAVVSTPAHALLLVNDWTLTAGADTYTGIDVIGLNQVSSANTIVQDTPFAYVGQTFSETGTMTSFGYGAPDTAFSPFLLTTTSLNGKVIGVSSGIDYILTSGFGSVTAGATTLFDLVLVAGAGDLATTTLGDGNNGSSLVLFNIVNNAESQASFAGQADLLYALNINGLFLSVDTDNFIKSSPVCTDDGCSFTVASQGSAQLLRVPEPESVALFGIGLLGLVAARRKVVRA